MAKQQVDTFKIEKVTRYKKNPRKITQDDKEWLAENMAKLGDLGGITINRPTNEFITGNQRGSEIDFSQAVVTWHTEYETPTEAGTVKMGTVEYAGEKFNVRLVDWDEERVELACIIANQNAGDWDAEILLENFDSDLLLETKFDVADMDRLLKEVQAGQGELDLKDTAGNNQADDDDEIENAYGKGEKFQSQVKMVQLFLNTTTHPIFMEKEEALRKHFNLETITDTILQALDYAYDKIITNKVDVANKEEPEEVIG